ncbi:MAG: hypothetical protein ACRED8_01810 [Caulobacteraceae bacterium]
MLRTIFATAALAAAALAVTPAAMAQPAPQGPNDGPPPAYPAEQPAPSAVPAASAGVNVNAEVVPSSDMTPAQVQALQNGDNQIVTNGPVPDTPQNRAKYGKPLSRAGRLSAPAGN